MKAIAYFCKILPDSGMSNCLYCTTNYRDIVWARSVSSDRNLCIQGATQGSPNSSLLGQRCISLIVCNLLLVWWRKRLRVRAYLCEFCNICEYVYGCASMLRVRVTAYVFVQCVCVCVCVCACGQILCQKIKSGYNGSLQQVFYLLHIYKLSNAFSFQRELRSSTFQKKKKKTCFKMFTSEKNMVHNSMFKKILEELGLLYMPSACCSSHHRTISFSLFPWEH